MKLDRNQKLLIAAASASGVIALVFLAIGLFPRATPEPAELGVTSAKVHISEDGFAPATLKVKSGTVVIWVNDDTEEHRVAANPFGTHAELPELDSATNIAPSSSYSFEFNRAGRYHYHDVTHPESNGTVEVTE